MCDRNIRDGLDGARSRPERASFFDETVLELAEILLMFHADEGEVFQSACRAEFSQERRHLRLQ